MDLKIKTYIKKDKNFIIKETTENDGSLFADIDDIQNLDKAKLDYDYFEGALIIEYQGKKLLDFENWDLIDQLLSYFIDAFERLREDDKTHFQFPDQPFPVMLEKNGENHIDIYLDEEKTTLPKMKFISSMLVASENFYKQMSELFPEYTSDINYWLTRITDVKKKYNL